MISEHETKTQGGHSLIDIVAYFNILQKFFIVNDIVAVVEAGREYYGTEDKIRYSQKLFWGVPGTRNGLKSLEEY